MKCLMVCIEWLVLVVWDGGCVMLLWMLCMLVVGRVGREGRCCVGVWWCNSEGG